jgi:8-amino-7-oxononanoate synthase
VAATRVRAELAAYSTPGSAAATTSSMDAWLQAQLERLRAGALYRDPSDSELHLQLEADGGFIDACSNDYLGLAARTVSRETLDAIGDARAGAGASRLVQGTWREHRELEQELADWVGLPGALLGSSAFAANAGTIPALVEPESLIVSDRLNHASIVDGCRLAKAKVVVTPHLDLQAVELALRARPSRAPTWVLVEALFSMDGDAPDLVELRKLCDRYEAGLYVDEAHSLGVLGPQGAGLAAEQRVRPDALVAGLGKAVGAQGGFVAGSQELRDWLWNRARSFVFSTAPSPLMTRLAHDQARAAKAAEAARQRLVLRSQELRSALTALGLPIAAGSRRGPIVPIVLGSNERALAVMEALRRERILAQAIRPPTVPVGEARLRLTAHADWPDDAVPRIARALEAACAS